MRISTIAALSSLATLISAVPLDKRVLVIHTAYESVTETVDVYTTVTLKAGEQPKVQNAAAPVSTTKHVQHKHKPFRSKASTSTTPAAVQYSAPVPGPPTSTPSPPAPVQSSPAPVVIAPPPPSSTLAPVQSSSAPVVIAPAPVSSPPVPVSSSTTSQPPLPQTSSIPSAPVNAPSSPESDGGSSGGSCGEPGGACSGELTYYDAGLGSCGIVNDGTTEKVFALAHGRFNFSQAWIQRLILTNRFRHDGSSRRSQPQ